MRISGLAAAFQLPLSSPSSAPARHDTQLFIPEVVRFVSLSIVSRRNDHEKNGHLTI